MNLESILDVHTLYEHHINVNEPPIVRGVYAICIQST